MSSEIILEKRPIPWYGVLAIILVSALGVGALVLFAFQTWEFVDWLFPSEQFLYKALAVANFDVMSVVWISLELFVPLTHASKNTAIIAGGFDFVLSIFCTVVQMVRSSQSQFAASALAPGWITFAYVLIILALVINLVSLLVLFRSEWPYISGERVRVFTGRPVLQPHTMVAEHPQPPAQQAPKQIEAPKEKPLTADDIIRIMDERERNKKEPVAAGAGAGSKEKPRFLASQAREQVTAQAAKPKKQIPPLRRPKWLGGQKA